jgi:hypothetical protein
MWKHGLQSQLCKERGEGRGEAREQRRGEREGGEEREGRREGEGGRERERERISSKTSKPSGPWLSLLYSVLTLISCLTVQSLEQNLLLASCGYYE